MKKIAVYGSGGFGREVRMLIEQINQHKNEFNFIGYFDDRKQKGTAIGNHIVLGGIQDLNNISEEIYLVVSIADPEVKVKIICAIENENVRFPVLIHPSSIIGQDSVSIGAGSIICAGTILTVDITIGDHVILNLGCTVGHDTKIGSYSSFMPAVNISGEVEIGDRVYCGTGAKLVNQLKIGKGTIIGAGAVVAKDLPACCTAVGIPAKPIKFHNEK